MKLSFLFIAFFVCQVASSQKPVTIRFKNDYPDVYHLALIVYTPDGKNQTRVSNLVPSEEKEYTFPDGTEIFVADRKQEAFAMKGNDVKASGVKPTIVLKDGKRSLPVLLSALSERKNNLPK